MLSRRADCAATSPLVVTAWRAVLAGSPCACGDLQVAAAVRQ